MQKHGVSAVSQFTKVTTGRLAKLAELVDQGVLKVHIDNAFPLEQASDALDYVHAGPHRGKVVIKISG